MVAIRDADVQDAAAIAHVHVQSWLTTYAGIVPAEYLASLNEAERTLSWRERLGCAVDVFVAEVDGPVIGFASGGPLREPLGNNEAELYAIYLLEAAQGKGTGRRLVSRVAASLLAKGFTSMIVWVLEQNPAVLFYERLGAQRVASKQVEIGGASLREIALGWRDLKQIALATATAV
ncbi:MAG: GNAT family N-acetyltransferase [Terracidiphilus sp.]|jgi:L-amino acid N-acyltransferase YncA